MQDKCGSLSLEQIASITAENLSNSTKMYINVSTSQLLIQTRATFIGLDSLALIGTHINTTIICERGSFAGLTFTNINRLALSHLTIINCGAIFTSKSFNYSSAIMILRGRDIVAESLNILSSAGTGMTVLEHKGGTVRIESSHFIENKIPEFYSSLKINGGGGVYVGDFKQDPSEPITFQFNNCTFKQNIAHTLYYDFLYTDDLGQPISGYGKGGGVAIVLKRGLTDIHVLFSGCTFRDNEAFKGGGLVSEIEGALEKETRNVSLRVENSLFEGNGCNVKSPTGSGGGVSINFSVRNRTNFDSNQFLLYNVTFYKNCAEFGGGLYFYSKHLENASLSNTVDIDKCVFIGNSAHTGSAVDVTPHAFDRLSNGILTTPVFRDCNFSNNTVIVNFQANHTQTTYGIGTVYISLFNVRFEGHNIFERNFGTPIHIVNGNVDMAESSIDIIENIGIRGGAIALIGVSSMIIGRGRSYKFAKNTAIDRGGALYVEVFDNHDVTASKTCFIQYLNTNSYYLPTWEWNATVTFSGNKADTGIGHTIFVTSLYPCLTINVGDIQNNHLESIDPSNVFTLRRITIDEDTRVEGQQIATEGAILRHDEQFKEVIPGEQFAHGVSIRDDLDNEAKVVLAATIPNNTNVKLDKAFLSCVGEKLVLVGKPGKFANLHLHTTTSRLIYTSLRVKLIDCPPGFLYSETSSKCVCIFHEYVGMLMCNTTVFHGYITSGFWMGMVRDAINKTSMELVTSYCPQNFCNYNSTSITGLSIRLPRYFSQLNEAQCGKSRTGIACGNCSHGYTTYFHSPNYQCKPADPTLCKIGWLFYILSELVPVTAVFILVVTLNISFTSGLVQGFVLFSQLLTSLNIDASGIIVLPPGIAKLSEGYRVLYGFFNLEFFQIESLSFCIWHSATALDMLAFKYVTIIYALLLVMLVIWFMNSCGGRCIGKWFRITTVKSSVIHGISAFLILCYSQCIRVSLSLLNTYTPFIRDNSNLNVSKRVWLNGNIEYFSKHHLPYALPAMFCLLVVGVFPPLLLLAYPFSNKVMAFLGMEESKPAMFIYKKLRFSSLKPLLDSFQGSFKDNMRFFSGLYFLYRWITLTLTVILTDFNRIYTSAEIFFIVILVFHSLCQPYAWKIHNVIDTLLFGNLALINAMSFAHYYIFRTMAGKQTATSYITASASIQLVLIYLPLVIMAMYVFTRVCLHVCKKVDGNNTKQRTYSSAALQKLTSSFSKEDEVEEELPHRLIAGDVDYECCEDTVDTTKEQNYYSQTY